MTKKKKQKPFVFDTRLIYFLAVIVFVVGLGLLGWFVYGLLVQSQPGSPISFDNDKETKQEDCLYRRALNGACVFDQKQVFEPLVAVMVENHIDARPQSGLADAGVVYEAPVEGNITRFLALYPASSVVLQVGPIRSARPYYLDWLSEYGKPLYMHVGGSPDALENIKAFEINDMNEFYYGGLYFWRSVDRSAPHNTYTKSDMWQKVPEKNSEEERDEYVSWKFDEKESCTEQCTDSISVSFGTSAYTALWQWSSSTNQYARFQSGRVHKDKNGEPLYADTVIVQKVNTKVLDSEGRLLMNTVGSGDTVVFRDGFATKGVWKKVSRTARTQFFTEQGEEIPLRAGKIWIEVVNGVGEVQY